MDLNDVVVFVRVARERSFTRAAKALDLPKSTVSERVARLEQRLGVRLLDRTTRSLRLTETGQEYYDRVEGLVQELEDAEGEVSAAFAAPRGVLRVGSPLLIAQAFLSDLVADYLLRYPDVELELVLEDRAFDLVAENLDLAVHVIGPLDPSMVARKLGMGERICVASPLYVRERGAPGEPSELRAHACVVSGPSRKACWTFARGGESISVSVSGRYAVTSVELAYRAARRGIGVAVLPSFLCHEALLKGDLVRLLPEWASGEATVQIVYASGRHLSGRARAFADMLIERSTRVIADLPRFEVLGR